MADDPTELVPAPDALPDTAIDDVVSALKAMQEAATLQFALAVGQLIVERVYGGDMGRYRTRTAKDASLRRLAEHPDLPFGAATLYRAVNVYDVVHRLHGGTPSPKLTFSHYRTVLGLPEEKQTKLLTSAESKAWPVAKLEAEAKKVRAAAPKGGGRPPLSETTKVVNALQRILGEAGDLITRAAGADDLTPEQARAVMEAATALKVQCSEIQERLRGRLNGAGAWDLTLNNRSASGTPSC